VSEGVVVLFVDRNSPAARAGLARGDIITGIAGQPITSGGDLRRLLRARRPGDTVTAEVVRGRRRTSVSIRLGEVTES
jgi:S1-C subfamily serine protease